MQLIDTHCHIHEADDFVRLQTETRTRYEKAGVHNSDEILAEANAADVTSLICVGTTLEDSELAVHFAQKHKNVWASIGLHPHEAKLYVNDLDKLARFATLAKQSKVVAVGECGLDYFYNHSSKVDQEKILRFQMELALSNDLPMIFHVREAFEDFWPILDGYVGVRGVIHSFTATQKELDATLKRGLYVGLNGIVTFTTNAEQLAAIKSVPLEKMLLETDAPFLTPKPYRGKICMPKHVRLTAEFLSDLRGETLERIADVSTSNARFLFSLET